MTATLMEAGDVVEKTDVRRPGMGAVLRSEWIKLTTVRSTWWRPTPFPPTRWVSI